MGGIDQRSSRACMDSIPTYPGSGCKGNPNGSSRQMGVKALFGSEKGCLKYSPTCFRRYLRGTGKVIGEEVRSNIGGAYPSPKCPAAEISADKVTFEARVNGVYSSFLYWYAISILVRQGLIRNGTHLAVETFYLTWL